MLSSSDTDIQEVSSAILNQGYDVAFLVPTQTGLKKSILDAHKSVNSLFKRTGIHDYSLQKQGSDNKVQLESCFITKDDVLSKTVSLYRPNTKKGDPRIWIYGLKALAIAGNLLALIVVDQKLYIVNCSHGEDLVAALKSELPKLQKTINPVAEELLQKLVVISRKGFIDTVVHGDTGVGMTLENELGITANSSRQPDYKGIEIKSARVDDKKKQKNRSQLFSKAPNWKLSPIGSAKNLIEKRGYRDSDQLMALRQTIRGDKPNAQGLYLDIDHANDFLRQMFHDEVAGNEFSPVHDTTWVLKELKSSLVKKHKETFWVKARHNNNRAAERFHYVEVEHTENPYIEKLETLIETGLITLDYTMHIKPTGKIRDHGYLFKLKQNCKTVLFPATVVYDLLA